MAGVQTRPRSASDADRRKQSLFLTKRTIAAIKSRYRPQGRIIVRTRPSFVAEDRLQQVRQHAFNPKFIILVLGATYIVSSLQRSCSLILSLFHSLHHELW